MLFLSHSGADTEEAKSLASLLRQAGVEVWLDVERLQPGNRWMEELETALRVANSFAVYVGKSGVQRWVDREVRVALERNTAESRVPGLSYSWSGSKPERASLIPQSTSTARSQCGILFLPSANQRADQRGSRCSERESRAAPARQAPFSGPAGVRCRRRTFVLWT
jgi:hypothetical protein